MIINNKKNKELFLYFIFGISTTLVNILIFQGLLICEVDYKLANLFAVIIGKLYAYITNKKFVFKSKRGSALATFKEFLRFVYARGITGLIDYFGLIIVVECLGVSPVWTKYALQILIIILNYIFSKMLVFKSNIDKKID